jgi:hypothetical protein
VGGNDDRRPWQKAADGGQDLVRGFGIQPLGRFVEQQNARTAQEHTGQGKPPRLAARQARAALAKRHVQPAAVAQRLGQPKRRDHLGHFRLGRVGDSQPQGIAYAARHQTAALRQVADGRAQAGFVEGGKRLAGKIDGPGQRGRKPGNRRQERTLAGSGATRQGHGLAGCDRKADGLRQRERTLRRREGQARDTQKRDTGGVGMRGSLRGAAALCGPPEKWRDPAGGVARPADLGHGALQGRKNLGKGQRGEDCDGGDGGRDLSGQHKAASGRQRRTGRDDADDRNRGGGLTVQRHQLHFGGAQAGLGRQKPVAGAWQRARKRKDDPPAKMLDRVRAQGLPHRLDPRRRADRPPAQPGHGQPAANSQNADRERGDPRCHQPGERNRGEDQRDRAGEQGKDQPDRDSIQRIDIGGDPVQQRGAAQAGKRGRALVRQAFEDPDPQPGQHPQRCVMRQDPLAIPGRGAAKGQ